MRRAAGDQSVPPGQRQRRRQQRLDRRQDRRWFRKPPRAEFVAGHRALVRPDHMDAARSQQCHVRLRRGVQPHANVHRRSDQHRLVSCQQQRRRQIARKPRGHLRQDVGRGRRHHDKIGTARKLYVSHLAFIGQREQVGIDLAFAQRLQRQRRDELCARLGQHTAYPAATPAQQTDQLQRLVRGDAARDDQQHALTQKVSPSPCGRGLGGGGRAAHSRHPEWIAAIPPDRLRTATRANPASFNIATNVS